MRFVDRTAEELSSPDWLAVFSNGRCRCDSEDTSLCDSSLHQFVDSLRDNFW